MLAADMQYDQSVVDNKPDLVLSITIPAITLAGDENGVPVRTSIKRSTLLDFNICGLLSTSRPWDADPSSHTAEIGRTAKEGSRQRTLFNLPLSDVLS